jgi:hypothetical protein
MILYLIQPFWTIPRMANSSVRRERYPSSIALRLLEKFPPLHIFGMTARWDIEHDPIAAALVALVAEKWERCAIGLATHRRASMRRAL